MSSLSRSLKAIRTNTDWIDQVIYDFLLVIHSDYVDYLVSFREKW